MPDVIAPVAAYDSALPAQPRPAVTITKFVPCARGSLIGWVDVKIAADYLTLHWVAVHQSGDRCWIRLPHASAERRSMFFRAPLPYLDELGALGFEREVIAAVRAAYPDVLSGERAP